jgi:hypothetical protein
MHDNKVRLSQDVLEKANHIAQEWGLKNARAAVEAVFRRYCDDYLHGRAPDLGGAVMVPSLRSLPASHPAAAAPCEAIAALDQLLAL